MRSINEQLERARSRLIKFKQSSTYGKAGNPYSNDRHPIALTPSRIKLARIVIHDLAAEAVYVDNRLRDLDIGDPQLFHHTEAIAKAIADLVRYLDLRTEHNRDEDDET